MIDIISPLQKLDDAVQEFFRATEQLEGGAFITGWAIGVSMARIQSENDSALPLVDTMTYAFGPQTSLAQLAGVAKYLDIVAENAMYSSLRDDD